jgi:hypothetical protein
MVLCDPIISLVRAAPRRREVESQVKTIADMLREEGRKEEAPRSRQQILVRQLRLRFGRVPRPVEQVIRSTNDAAQLDKWLENFATAQTLADVGIPAQADQ